MKIQTSQWAAALITIALSASSAYASMNTQKNLNDMANASTAVVTGKVMSKRTEYANGQTMTKVRVRITDELKGDVSEFITVDIPGGSFQTGKFSIGESGSNGHTMFSEDDALLFLNKNKETNTFSLSNKEQGYTPINNSDDGLSQQNALIGNKTMSLQEIKTELKTNKEEK